MKKNTFKYIGYDYIASKKERKDIEINSTKAYKALRAAFLDSITIEVAPPSDTKRNDLREIIMNSFNFNDKGFMVSASNTVIVVPTVETLGGTHKDACDTYDIILGRLHIIILNRPDLSTITLNGEVLVELSDKAAIQKLKTEFACTKTTTRGRKAISIDAKFRKVFWSWQNYYIDTQDAIDLLGCSRQTLYSLAQEFITSNIYGDVYYDEYYMLEDYEMKAIRGINLDEDTKEVLIQINRTIGNCWTLEKVIDALAKQPNEKIKFPMRNDYIRLRNNLLYGRAAMVSATREYSKGKEYVEQLKKEINSI